MYLNQLGLVEYLFYFIFPSSATHSDAMPEEANECGIPTKEIHSSSHSRAFPTGFIEVDPETATVLPGINPIKSVRLSIDNKN